MLRLLIALLCTVLPAAALATTCEQAARDLNRSLASKIDERELADALHYLNKSRNSALPTRYVTKREAQAAGWRPGKDLWSVPALQGRSIGGDRFGNYEKRLPSASKRSWKEADLAYKGGKRGAKRLLFSNDGLRMVTVDHYQTFSEVPACQ